MTSTPNPNGAQHPAVVRLHNEFVAAYGGVLDLVALDDEHRDRMVAEIRSALPDVASRTAREAGVAATVDEVRRHAGADAGLPEPLDRLWSEVVDRATQAATATADCDA